MLNTSATAKIICVITVMIIDLLVFLTFVMSLHFTETFDKYFTTSGSLLGMFIVQGFFEMFEVLLSYFSNTLSFVRIGAYAVSHAAMMQVVMMLAGAESGTPNILVVILGQSVVIMI